MEEAVKRLVPSVLVALLVVSCHSKHNFAHAPGVTDSRAWWDVPLIELETHRRFAALPREDRPLSDGSHMWLYYQCSTQTSGVRCFSAATRVGQSTIGNVQCSGGDVSRSCCIHEFIVRESRVASYHPVGACMVGCGYGPESKTRACVAMELRDDPEAAGAPNGYYTPGKGGSEQVIRAAPAP